MSKRRVATGLAAAGIAAFATGMVASPAHADVECTADTFFILYAGDGTPASECTQGQNVTYDLPSRGIDLIRAGGHSGYLVRAADGRHVRFTYYQERYFGPAGVVFSQIHFN